MNRLSVKRQRQIVSIEYLDAWKMEGGSILKRHGERHIQVNGDLPLPLTLMLLLLIDAAAAAAAAADTDARCVHTLM